MAFFEAIFGLDQNDAVAFTRNIRESKEINVTFSVFQDQRTFYQNFDYPRFKGFYGYAQVMSGEFVVEEIPLNFLNQDLFYYINYTPQIADTVICVGKLIVSGIAPGTVLTAAPIRTRCHISSIRFKLRPGVLANAAVKYQTYESSCGNGFVSPDQREGDPPAANNSSYDPGEQPSETEEDELDPTRNDGVGEGDQPGGTPPAAGGNGGGTWFQVLNWSEAPQDVFSTGDTNPDSVWTAGGQCFNTVEGDADPSGRFTGVSFYKNGTYVGCAEDSNKGFPIALTFTYVLNP